MVVSGAACGIGRHAFLPGVFAAKAFPFVSTQPGIGGEGDCGGERDAKRMDY